MPSRAYLLRNPMPHPRALSHILQHPPTPSALVPTTNLNSGRSPNCGSGEGPVCWGCMAWGGNNGAQPCPRNSGSPSKQLSGYSTGTVYFCTVGTKDTHDETCLGGERKDILGAPLERVCGLCNTNCTGTALEQRKAT